MNSEQSINSVEIKMNRSPDYLLDNYFFLQFFDNFSALLLCEINVLDIFNISDFFQFFVITRRTEIVIVSNFWVRVYP